MESTRRDLIKNIGTMAAGIGLGKLSLEQLEALPPEVVSTLPDYTALQNYVGDSNIILVTETSIRGFFYFDPTNQSAPDGGTIFLRNEVVGKWVRIFDGMPNAKWFREVTDLAVKSFKRALLYAVRNDVTLFIDDSEVYEFNSAKIALAENQNLKLFGKGKIKTAAKINDPRTITFVRPGENSIISINGPSFSGFKRVVNANFQNSTPISYELDIQNVRVNDCDSFIFASSSEGIKGCRKALITNCYFQNLKGRVIAIKASNSHDIMISNNVFKEIISTGSDHKTFHNVIDIGHGDKVETPGIALSSKIVISKNTIEDVEFLFKSAAILVTGAEQVVITDNVLRNIRGVFDASGSDDDTLLRMQTDGIYVKAIKTVISNNVVHNASTGEGAIKVKGIGSYSSSNFDGNAPGYEVVISNNYVSFDPDYLIAHHSYGTGIMADGDRILVIGNQLNYVSTGIRVTPALYETGDPIIGNSRIHSNQITNLFSHNDFPSNQDEENQRIARGIYVTRGFNHLSILNNSIQSILVDDESNASKVATFGIQMVDIRGDVHIGQNNFQDLFTPDGRTIMINFLSNIANLNISNNVFNNVRTCFRIYPPYQQKLNITNAIFAQNVATNVAEGVFYVDNGTVYINCKIVDNQSDETCSWQYPQYDSFLSEEVPPVASFYENGDIVWRFEPAVGENIGWIFVSGAWQTFGVIA